uniref:Uncharacterized protein n=1 Tax=Solanum lycopersicum TaxID=4081 RepID=K4BQZ2_SOLLC
MHDLQKSFHFPILGLYISGDTMMGIICQGILKSWPQVN